MSSLSLDVLAGMAHELRTPLGAIGGYSELLELGVHGPVTPAQVDGLRRIRNNQQLMVSLLNAFMSYAEAATGGVSLQMEAVHLPALLSLEARQLMSRAAERNVSLDGFELGPQAPQRSDVSVVRADIDALETLVRELLVDAVESAPSGGSVRVHLANESTRCLVHVETSGEPFVPGTEESVFDPFSRVAKSNRPSAARHALSLPHARLLARLMNGEVVVRPDPTRRLVTLSLPLA